MRTIRTKIYLFSELNSAAQEKAINDFRNSGVETDFIYFDIEKTVKAFNDVFNIKTGRNSWLEFSTNHIDDDILNLSGLRLRKYLLNNFGATLYQRKYLKNGGISDNFKKYHPMRKQREILENCENKGKISVSYYSNIFVSENECNLTGVCYDYDIMQPIYDFLKNPDQNTNFNDLIDQCFEAINKTVKNEIDYLNSDEAIKETLTNNDYEFTKDGNIF